MATNAYVLLKIPEAVELADLIGIQADLKNVQMNAEKLGQILVDAKDYEFVEALSITILVYYSRPFVTGVRKNLKDDALAVLNSEQRKWHDYFRNIRDKHIAHSVNAFEENAPTARYWVERVQSEGITSIGLHSTRIIGLSHHDTDAILDLVSTLLKHVDALIEDEQEKLLAVVREKPLEDVLRLNVSPYHPASDEVARKPRRRFEAFRRVRQRKPKDV